MDQTRDDRKARVQQQCRIGKDCLNRAADGVEDNEGHVDQWIYVIKQLERAASAVRIAIHEAELCQQTPTP